jgi:hypothetical protein
MEEIMAIYGKWIKWDGGEQPIKFGQAKLANDEVINIDEYFEGNWNVGNAYAPTIPGRTIVAYRELKA